METEATSSGKEALNKLLSEQHQLAGELLNCLSDITGAMSDGGIGQEDTKNLESLLGRKSSILDRLDVKNSGLQSWLQQNGYSKNAVSEAILAQSDHSELLSFWREFQQLIHDCQLQNTANNSLANGRIAHTRQALNVLTNSDNNLTASYAEDGKPSDQRHSRPWAKA